MARFLTVGKTQATAVKIFLDKHMKGLSLDQLVKETGSAQNAVALIEFKKRVDESVAEE